MTLGQLLGYILNLEDGSKHWSYHSSINTIPVPMLVSTLSIFASIQPPLAGTHLGLGCLKSSLFFFLISPIQHTQVEELLTY